MWLSFLKAIRWYLLAFGGVVGTSAFIVSNNTGSTKPIILGVFAYGLIYIMSYFWKEFRGKLLLGGLLVFLFISFAQPYIPDVLYILFDYRMGRVNPYFFWMFLELIIGLPLMTLVFKIWGD